MHLSPRESSPTVEFSPVAEYKLIVLSRVGDLLALIAVTCRFPGTFTIFPRKGCAPDTLLLLSSLSLSISISSLFYVQFIPGGKVDTSIGDGIDHNE